MSKQFQVTVPEDMCDDVINFIVRKEYVKVKEDVAKVYLENSFLLVFTMSAASSRECLEQLDLVWKIGTNFGKIDVLNVVASKPAAPVDKKKKGFSLNAGRLDEDIHNEIASGNSLSFDYLAFTIIAGVIASAGLAGNSPAVVVASMLVSPLMGPILATTLGVTHRDWKAVFKGLLNEAIGLTLCVLIGAICGLGFLPFGQALEFPTNEMSSRGQPWGLILGILIAVPSGAGVALGVSSGGINSLVGVAISASLLPPACNAGLLIIYGLFGPFIFGDDVNREEHVIMGVVSLCLTIINILCIYVAGAVSFKIRGIGALRIRQRRLITKPIKMLPLVHDNSSPGSHVEIVDNHTDDTQSYDSDSD